MTERIINSAVTGRRLRVATDGDRDQWIALSYLLRGETFARDGRVIDVNPDELADALNGIVPGFTAKYEPPVVVPEGIGAVVRSRNTSQQYVRVHPSSDPKHLAPWLAVGRGSWFTNTEIAGLLRAGSTVESEGVDA